MALAVRQEENMNAAVIPPLVLRENTSPRSRTVVVASTLTRTGQTRKLTGSIAYACDVFRSTPVGCTKIAIEFKC